jgi:hypothetical protein
MAMVGLPGFEPGSREPKSHSLDQASRQPLELRDLDPILSFSTLRMLSTVYGVVCDN